MNLNDFYLVSQEFHQPSLANVREEVIGEFKRKNISRYIRKNERVAITAGSRGIARRVEIFRTLVEQLKLIGAKPFIVPAMGSHGGFDGTGEIDVLRNLGITEESVGAEIVPGAEVVELGRTEGGATVFFDRNAYEADAVFVVNRIKPHTKFRGTHESGLLKMIAIGLGKGRGCSEMHAHGLYPEIVNAALLALEKAPIICALGIVENAHHEVATVEMALKDEIADTDARLLTRAKTLMPTLPVDDIDLLVVSEAGKNISGSGMDVNVIGRMHSFAMSEERPRIRRIVLLDLHRASHGNAIGMALADIVTRRYVDKVDFNATYANVLASGGFDKGKIPVIQESDYDAVSFALRSLQAIKSSFIRTIFIKNTLELEKLVVSARVFQDKACGKKVKFVEKTKVLFDDDGKLLTQGWW
jgi:hypothetical protein